MFKKIISYLLIIDSVFRIIDTFFYKSSEVFSDPNIAFRKTEIVFSGLASLTLGILINKAETIMHLLKQGSKLLIILLFLFTTASHLIILYQYGTNFILTFLIILFPLSILLYRIEKISKHTFVLMNIIPNILFLNSFSYQFYSTFHSLTNLRNENITYESIIGSKVIFIWLFATVIQLITFSLFLKNILEDNFSKYELNEKNILIFKNVGHSFKSIFYLIIIIVFYSVCYFSINSHLIKDFDFNRNGFYIISNTANILLSTFITYMILIKSMYKNLLNYN
jgi:hypothetical protein